MTAQLLPVVIVAAHAAGAAVFLCMAAIVIVVGIDEPTLRRRTVTLVIAHVCAFIGAFVLIYHP